MDKKGKRSYYGYNGFVVTDEDGYINTTHVTPANKSEVTEFSEILPLMKAKRVYADKGYASEDNRSEVRSNKMKNGIMYKASKGKALTKWLKQFNRYISKVRYVIEQSFGTLKRRFMLSRTSYLGLEKVQGQLTLKAICYNLLKGINMLKLA